MENMNTNNINNNESKVELDKENMEPGIFEGLDNDNAMKQENPGQAMENKDDDQLDKNAFDENNFMPAVYGSMYEDNMPPHESYNHKGEYASIKNKPKKRNIFKKVAPYMAFLLVAALVGGASAGAYVNYMYNKDYQYTPPSVTQGAAVKTVSYSQPESLISKIASEVGPSVVGVDTQTVTQGFFGQQQTGEASGSGIIFDKNGYIVTNQHVIDGSSSITVTLPGGKTYPAKVIGQDPTTDIAVIKIDAANLPAAKFGDSSTIRVGDLAVAIGNPMGEEFAGSVTSGIISALDRSITMDDGDYTRMYKLIQTDAAINPGNSGGALIDSNGEVIGINSIKFATTGVQGMGFAIPINDVKTIINDLMTQGYVLHPYLGLQVEAVSSDMAQMYNIPAGLGVDSVTSGSPAQASGIKQGDIILQFDGIKLSATDDLANNLAKHKAGDVVKLTIWRNGSTRTISVTVGQTKGLAN